MKKGQKDESQEEKIQNENIQNGSGESLELCAQIGVLGMSDSLTNTTSRAIMRQCQQNTVGDGEGEGAC